MTEPAVEVTLLGKPGCHLCDVAAPIVRDVVARVPGATLREVSILDSAALTEQWGEHIPVVLIDGERHAIWRVDAQRLETRLRDRLAR